MYGILEVFDQFLIVFNYQVIVFKVYVKDLIYKIQIWGKVFLRFYRRLINVGIFINIILQLLFLQIFLQFYFFIQKEF